MEKNIDFELFKKLLELEHQKYVPTNDIEGFKKYETLLNNFTNDLRRYLSGNGFVVEYGCGIGNLAYIPWIRIAYPEISSDNKKGFFIGYQFGWDDHHAFLSILQGVDSIPPSEQKRVLLHNKDILRPLFSSGSFIKPTSDWTPRIEGAQAKIKKGTSYADAMICYKPYQFSRLPSPEELEKDLLEAIKIYDEIKPLVIEHKLVNYNNINNCTTQTSNAPRIRIIKKNSEEYLNSPTRK